MSCPARLTQGKSDTKYQHEQCECKIILVDNETKCYGGKAGAGSAAQGSQDVDLE